MKKTLEAINNEITAIVTERAKLRETYAKKLEDARASLKTAKEKKVAMVSAENVKGVRAAIDEMKDAAAAIEIFETKLNGIPEKSLIGYDEAERFQDRIFVAYRDREAEIMKRAKAHFEALDKLADECDANADECDELVKRIRYSLCDDDRYYVVNKGKRFTRIPVPSVGGERPLSQLVQMIREQFGYKVIRGLVTQWNGNSRRQSQKKVEQHVSQLVKTEDVPEGADCRIEVEPTETATERGNEV